jgi:hypothetical protein
MKEWAKNLICHIVQNDILWRLMNGSLLRVTRFAEFARREEKNRRIVQPAIQAVCPDLVVKRGPFQGMRYPEIDSIGRYLFPKLFGTYEREIQSVVETICAKNYTEIVNIGCGEGYYAVGLARRIPGARVYAYDIDKESIRLCMIMAELNGVSDRVSTALVCNIETLRAIPFTKRGLIVCDCEGYERTLFTHEGIDLFLKHDVLVEIHDFIDISTSSYIWKLFEVTHDILSIESVDDIKKAKTYSYRELEGYDLETRRILLGEYRASIMEWLYMQARPEGVS